MGADQRRRTRHDHNFGGEQAAWGPLELTNYGFDVRIHNFARTINNPCP